MNKLSIFLFFIGLSFLSCEYEFEDHFVYIEKTDPSTVNSDFFNSKDTIYIREKTSLNLRLSTPGEIVGYKILIDDELKEEYDGPTNHFILNPRLYSTGYHQLKLEVYEKSNSGSFVDKRGQERFTHKFEKVVLIDNEILQSIKIENASVNEKGHLVIEWEKYEGYKFGRYLIKFESNGYEILNQDINFLKLPSYAGGNVRIGMIVEAKNGLSKSNYYDYAYDFNFNAAKLNINDLHLTWNKSPFEATVEFVVIVYNSFDFSDKTIISFTDISQDIDEIISYPTTFPYNFQVQLYVINSDGTMYPAENYGVLTRSSTSPNINLIADPDIVFINNNILYSFYPNFACCSDNIRRYDLTNHEIINQLSGKFSISPDKKSMFSASMPNNTTVHIMEHDINNLNGISQLKIDLPAQNHVKINGVYVSDDQYVFVSYAYSAFRVYHWPTKTIVYEGFLSTSNFLKSTTLGTGGKFLISRIKHTNLSSHSPSTYFSKQSADIVINVPSKNQTLYYAPDINKVILEDIESGNQVNSFNMQYEVKQLYTNSLNHWAALVLTDDEQYPYKFQVFSFTDGNLTVELDLNNSALPGDFLHFKFENNYILLTDESLSSALLYYEQLDFTP